MKIGRKMVWGFTGLALLTGIVGGLCIFQTKISQDIVEREVYKSIENLNDVWTLMEAQEHQEIAANNYLFLDAGLGTKRADYFYEKERLEKVYQKYCRESCACVKSWLEKYYENIKIFHIKIEEAFELHKQGVDLEVIKEQVRTANKYAEIAEMDRKQ